MLCDINKRTMKPEVINGIFGIAGAIIGALLTGGLTWLSAKNDKKKKRLAIYSTYSTKLIEISDLIRGNIEINLNSKKISELNKNEIIVTNTGNVLIENIEITFTLSESSAKLINVEKSQSNFDIALEDFEMSFNEKGGKLTIKYLNPGDQIDFIVLTDTQSIVLTKHRQKDVTTEIKTDYIPNRQGVLLDSFFEAMDNNFLLRSGFYFMPEFRKYKKSKKTLTSHNPMCKVS